MAAPKRKFESSSTGMGLGNQRTEEEDLAWVQCEHLACHKWRRISAKEAASLAIDLSWYCHMNDDIAHSSCEDPEEPYPNAEELDRHGLQIVFSQNYQTGSLVWTKMSGYPRWPAVVCPDPDNGKVKCNIKNDVCYHVEYLGQPRTRKWITIESIKPFSQLENVPPQAKKRGWLQTALKEANEMISLSCEERLHFCNFAGLNLRQGEKLLQDTHELLMEVEALNENAIEKKKCDSENEDSHLNQLGIDEESFQNAEDSPEEPVKAKTTHSDDSAEMLYPKLADENEKMENMLKETAAFLQYDD